MALINIVITLMISAKIATPSLKKENSAHDVTKDILSRDSNYIVEVSCEKSLVTQAFLWEKLS